MSIELIKNVFAQIPTSESWSIHLLGFKHSKRNGTIYNCRRIELESKEKVHDIIVEISQVYIGQNGSPAPEFDMDDDRTYLNTIIHIRDGFGIKDIVDEISPKNERSFERS